MPPYRKFQTRRHCFPKIVALWQILGFRVVVVVVVEGTGGRVVGGGGGGGGGELESR